MLGKRRPARGGSRTPLPENGDGISTGSRVGFSSADVGVFRNGVEAGALLDVFAWFYCAVVIEIGAEVAMTEDQGRGVDGAQGRKQRAERVTLLWRAGVGGDSLCVQAAFVGDADAMGVVGVSVCACEIEGAHGVDCAVMCYVEMIAAAGETA